MHGTAALLALLFGLPIRSMVQLRRTKRDLGRFEVGFVDFCAEVKPIHFRPGTRLTREIPPTARFGAYLHPPTVCLRSAAVPIYPSRPICRHFFPQTTPLRPCHLYARCSFLERHLSPELYLTGAVRCVTDHPEVRVVQGGVRCAEDRVIERILSF